MNHAIQDLSEPKWIYLKGFLFLLIGIASAALIFMEAPTIRVAVLLSLMTRGFCRSYYLAFYVTEKYVDARFRFSGLGSFVKYCFTRRH